MYNFRNSGMGINPDTGLTWQEEYEASLQQDNQDNGGFLSNIDWGKVGLIGGGLALAGLAAWNIFGGNDKENVTIYNDLGQPVGEKKQKKPEIMGIERNTFFAIIGLLVATAIITTIVILKRKGKI